MKTHFNPDERVSYNGLNATVLWQVGTTVAIRFDIGGVQVVPEHTLAPELPDTAKAEE